MLMTGWHHSHSHHHHINVTHPPLLSPPPHQSVHHHHHYHPTLTCQHNFTPIQPTSATTFFLNHNTHHHHHQRVLMTCWWVYLVSPPSPPPCSPLPSPSTTTLTMATNKSWRLVGVFFWSLHHPLHSPVSPLPPMSFNLVVNDKRQHNRAMRSSERMSEKWHLEKNT